jgi:hypothetical protein
MQQARNWTRLTLVALCAALSATACNSNDRADENVAGGTVTDAQVSVSEVKLGKGIDANRNITDETDDFAPTDQIYVAVETAGSAQNATLTARWTYEDGQVVDETTETLSPTGPAFTEFHIGQATGLPSGDYKVTILLNGSEVETKDFTVD